MTANPVPPDSGDHKGRPYCNYTRTDETTGRDLDPLPVVVYAADFSLTAAN